MSNKYKLEIKEETTWKMFGIYSEKTISQMAQHISNLAKDGYEMYKNMRIILVKDDGESNIL